MTNERAYALLEWDPSSVQRAAEDSACPWNQTSRHDTWRRKSTHRVTDHRHSLEEKRRHETEKNRHFQGYYLLALGRQYLRRRGTTWRAGLWPQGAGAHSFTSWHLCLGRRVWPWWMRKDPFSPHQVTLTPLSTFHFTAGFPHAELKGSFFCHPHVPGKDGAAQWWGEGSVRVQPLGPKPEWFTRRERSCLSLHSSSSLLPATRTQAFSEMDKPCHGAKGPFLPLCMDE